jgi:hypothetical protein
MAVSRVKTSSVLQGFPKYRSMLGGNAGFDPGATWLIERVNISSNTLSVTFSGIPSTYSSLQLRILSASTRAASANLNIQVNSNTGTVYTRHEINGDGTTVTSSGAVAGGVTTASIARSTGGDSGSNIYAASIIDIQDYASTTKNKTMRSFFGINNNGLSTENVTLRSVLYIGTDAITSLTLTSASSTSFIAGSTFALYGMK